MELLIALIIVSVVAYFIFKDAKDRGMNGAGWAVGIFLCMIIALPLYLIVRKPRKDV